MSPSLWFAGRALTSYIENDGAPPGRIYLDGGTDEGSTLRNVYQLADILERKGYRRDVSLRVVEDHGGRHEEAHWARRLAPALTFLLEGAAPRGR
jgi:hypothetical protein